MIKETELFKACYLSGPVPGSVCTLVISEQSREIVIIHISYIGELSVREDKNTCLKPWNSNQTINSKLYPVCVWKEKKKAKIFLFLKAENLSSFTKLRLWDMFAVFHCTMETYFLKACHLMYIQM